MMARLRRDADRELCRERFGGFTAREGRRGDGVFGRVAHEEKAWCWKVEGAARRALACF